VSVCARARVCVCVCVCVCLCMYVQDGKLIRGSGDSEFS